MNMFEELAKEDNIIYELILAEKERQKSCF